jgi:hypothetical protein
VTRVSEDPKEELDKMVVLENWGLLAKREKR